MLKSVIFQWSNIKEIMVGGCNRDPNDSESNREMGVMIKLAAVHTSAGMGSGIRGYPSIDLHSAFSDL